MVRNRRVTSTARKKKKVVFKDNDDDNTATISSDSVTRMNAADEQNQVIETALARVPDGRSVEIVSTSKIFDNQVENNERSENQATTGLGIICGAITRATSKQ